jgi:2'-5' RNA ligase
MSRLVVVLPLTPLRTGDSFPVSDWPLHITVLPPFHTDAAASVIAGVIAATASGRAALTAVAGGDALFGRREDVPVTLVDADPALTGLHRALVDAVRPFASAPDEPAFTGVGFRAHVTVKNGARVREGDRLTLSQIALVDMAPRAAADGRTVLATFALRVPGTIAAGGSHE